MTELSVNTPVYHSRCKDLRVQLMNEMLYIVHHAKESPFHLIGHLYLFLDYLIQSSKSSKLTSLSIAEVGSAVGYENQLHLLVDIIIFSQQPVNGEIKSLYERRNTIFFIPLQRPQDT